VDLTSELDRLECRVIDFDEARTTTHQEALLILAQTFNRAGAILLCEPSVVGGRSGPPDIAVVDPDSGVHVIEVKGVEIDQVRSVVAGGAIEILYETRTSRRDPSRQARQAMFDIKDSASRHFHGELNVPFQSWVVFPRITRKEWEHKFGEAVSSRSEVLFAEDLNSSELGGLLRRAGVGRLADCGLSECPPQQLQSVVAAFGDSEVLRPAPRPGPRPLAGSRGERLEEALAEYRVLTEQQQRLTLQCWNDGPRLVRGVAGSGKTVVLAVQVARMIEQLQNKTRDLFNPKAIIPPILAVCFNRTLVPFIRQRIEVAYRQRTGEEVPEKSVVVTHFNKLLYHLSRQGFFRYWRVEEMPDSEQRAARYLSDLEALTGFQAERLSSGLYYSIFVDEGQDFHEHDYRLLLQLCARTPRGLPRALVFYDDAQNLYGRRRPTWADLGLDVRGGRSVVMDESFRNPRQVIESALNVLLGTHATDPASVKTCGFADIATLRDKNLISLKGRHIRVHFSARESDPVILSLCDGKKAEEALLASRCESLMRLDGLLPQDILVLTFRKARARQLANAIATRIAPNLVRCAFNERDSPAVQPNRLTVSTIASAKGYDAPYVLLASLDDFPDDVEGRASLYVGCTRAREWLEVSGSSATALVREFETSLAASNCGSPPYAAFRHGPPPAP
jgi:AAA domain